MRIIPSDCCRVMFFSIKKCNRISCSTYCVQEDFIVTADIGADSMLVIWDTKTGIPKKTIFLPHKHGVQALDVSPDGEYILTLSHEVRFFIQPNNGLQTVSLWEWMRTKTPIVSCPIHPECKDYQLKICFNTTNIMEFLTSGVRRIMFNKWSEGVKGFENYGLNAPSGKIITENVFIPNTMQVVSGTNDGFIIVWDISLIMEDYSHPEERRAIKMVNFMNQVNKGETGKKGVSASINVLKIHEKYLVAGFSNGSIRFYDFRYRVVAWFDNFNIGSITSISFANNTMSAPSQFLFKETGDEIEPPFASQDFIVIDTFARITLLRSSLFDEIESSSKKGTVIMNSIVSPIKYIVVRPNSNILAISCENGNLYEWNFHDKSNFLTLIRQFEETNMPTAINFSPNGKFLSLGTNIGHLFIYDYEKSEWVTPLSGLALSETEKAKPYIKMQAFAPDSQHLATMDQEFAVCLFKIDHKYIDTTKPKEWVFCGKMRAHLRPITYLAFGESLKPDGEINLELFSIGEDRKLVKYDVSGSTLEKLKVLSVYDIEQECIPTSCIWYPINLYKENVLLVSNTDFKLKLWQFLDENKLICRKTCLGPTFGSPIKQIILIAPQSSRGDTNDLYLGYSTNEKIVGLIKLPLDGNPNNSMGLIAHPGEICSISATSDGKYFITAGEYSVNIWNIDVLALEENFFRFAFHSDQQEIPDEEFYPKFLEGGIDGQIHREVKDFFYYAQIRAKDEHTTKARDLDGRVPLESISEMMKALGFYPTLKEIENMQNEILYKDYSETGNLVHELNLDLFMKLFSSFRLYVNHRPFYSINSNNIMSALRTLTKKGYNSSTQIEDAINREDLIYFLQNFGEKMSESEIHACFEELLGKGELAQILPEKIDFASFINEVFGFEELNEQGSLENSKEITDLVAGDSSFNKQN